MAPVEPTFVAFSRDRLVLGRLGEVVEVPTVVGSTPSALTMASSAPGVVEVTPDGQLRAVSNGRATIRSLNDSNQQLEVVVQAVAGLAIVPEVVPLLPGEEIQLGLESPGDRKPLDPRAAQWSTTSPDVAVVIEGRLTAGKKPGRATIRATYGGQSAGAVVTVSAVQQRAAPHLAAESGGTTSTVQH